MSTIMSGTLRDVLNRMLNEAAKTDTALAAAMKTKKFDDCVAAIYDAFCKLVNHKNAAVNGSDDLLLSAAVHWYTEQNPTIDSIVDILKGGTEVHKLEHCEYNMHRFFVELSRDNQEKLIQWVLENYHGV